MTYYEKIKNMSVDELASEIGSIYFDEEINTIFVMDAGVYNTTKDIREWLKSEVKE